MLICDNSFEHITLELIYVSWSSRRKLTFKSIIEHITLELIYVSWSSSRKSTFKSIIEHITLEIIYVSWGSRRKPTFKSINFLALISTRMLLCVSLLLVTDVSAQYIGPISKYDQLEKNSVWTETYMLSRDVGEQLRSCLTPTNSRRPQPRRGGNLKYRKIKFIGPGNCF